MPLVSKTQELPAKDGSLSPEGQFMIYSKFICWHFKDGKMGDVLGPTTLFQPLEKLTEAPNGK